MRLTTTEIRYMSLFESVTGALARDCVVDGDTVVFVVKEGNMGLAIGKNGRNVKRLEQILGKRVELVEYAPDLKQFLKNVFYPANVLNVNVVERNGKRTAYVIIDSKDRRTFSRRIGGRIKLARLLARRHFKIDNVVVA